MREYELVLVVSPEGGEEGFPATVDRVHGLIKERGGEVKNVDRWGRRRLAYPLDRFTEGYYSISQFTLDPQDVRGIEGSLDLAEDILRHLVVRMEEPIVVRPELDPDAPVQKPAEAAAEGGETPTAEDAAETPAEESAELPAEDAAEATAEEPTEAPAEEPAEEPADAPAGAATEEPEVAAEEPETAAEASAEEPAETAADEPEEPAEEPAEKPVEAAKDN
ncbi:MAG TPA: 30S ribosomal protein S6 [Dehalococcoidia bacterium]